MKTEIKELLDKAIKLERKAIRYGESLDELRTAELEKLEWLEAKADKAFRIYLTAYTKNKQIT